MKLIIWDLDGVIIDSVEVVKKFMTDIFNQYGKDPSGLKDLKHGNINDFYNEFLKTPSENQKEISIEKFTELVRTHPMNKICDEMVKKETLDFIKETYKEGYIHAIATNTRHERVHKGVKNLEIEHLFKYIISSCDVEEPKPAPDMILKILEELDIKPEEAIFVDDSDEAIKAGIEAGTKTLLLTNKIEDIDGSIKEKITLITNDIKDLKKI
ncbi:MAG: HAD family hydrolase [Alphaproteobacteria bacterium]|nr:HAD family hydrolase [Alphaproteobacteria bacterium]